MPSLTEWRIVELDDSVKSAVFHGTVGHERYPHPTRTGEDGRWRVGATESAQQRREAPQTVAKFEEVVEAFIRIFDVETIAEIHPNTTIWWCYRKRSHTKKQEAHQ